MNIGDFVVRAPDRQVIYQIVEHKGDLALRRIAAWPDEDTGMWTDLIRRKLGLIKFDETDETHLARANPAEIEVGMFYERLHFLGAAS